MRAGVNHFRNAPNASVENWLQTVQLSESPDPSDTLLVPLAINDVAAVTRARERPKRAPDLAQVFALYGARHRL